MQQLDRPVFDSPNKQTVDYMLRTEPRQAGEQMIAIWQTLKPLDSELYLKYWRRVSDNASLDYRLTDFKQWVHFGDRCEGLIHRQTGRMYGMVRSINLHNWIEEQTYKHGRSHGISRIVYRDHVRIALN